MNWIIRPQYSALLAYLNIAVAIFGIYIVNDISIAMMCLVICAILDGVDGKFASLFKRTNDEKKFGILIDSLADTVAFAVFPAVIFLSIMPSTWLIIVPIIYILAGVTRLGVFSIEAKPDKRTSHFRGLPITSAGLIIPIFYLVAGQFSQDILITTLSVTYLSLALLYVLDFRVRKFIR